MNKPEPTASAVYWGVMDCPYLSRPLYKTEAEAIEVAKEIKSTTRVVPMYSSYPAMMQQPI